MAKKKREFTTFDMALIIFLVTFLLIGGILIALGQFIKSWGVINLIPLGIVICVCSLLILFIYYLSKV